MKQGDLVVRVTWLSYPILAINHDATGRDPDQQDTVVLSQCLDAVILYTRWLGKLSPIGQRFIDTKF